MPPPHVKIPWQLIFMPSYLRWLPFSRQSLSVLLPQVIFTLTQNVKLTHTEAVSLATIVDRKVRCACMK